ncbi:uncharacterized protein DUF397 [Asanoa ferruginea]|uniref:Uncharacterized protein DUF397 n=1 Tax=Asanoa ferruginea TaxID=53367 RepID=A0A3D9ZYG4_9ACTN|nr:DUF397 domain-containing protein [Asanoa ferruginea]REG01705.1 uncharacterized protein DUF397 [Asanoa ferruginea]GIF49262.1 transcriptional regulator [Asanoa ferruginea]
MTYVKLDRDALAWRVATRSAGGNCVQVAPAADMIAIRHSRRPDAEMIVYTRAEFQAFIDGAKDGEFDDLVK